MARIDTDDLPYNFNGNLNPRCVGNVHRLYLRFHTNAVPCGGRQMPAWAAGGHCHQNDDEKYVLHGVLCFEFIYFLRDARLWQHVEMQPRHAALDADIAREQVRVGFERQSSLLGGHVGNGEIPRFAEKVRGEVNGFLAFHHRAHVAPQPPLMLVVAVAVHGPLQNVPPDDEQAMEVIGVEELPCVLSPLFECMVAHQLVDVEELFDLG